MSDEDDEWTAGVSEPHGKRAVSIRLDEDVLAYFKKGGKGYQTRINAVLRTYMEAMERRKNEQRDD